MMCENKINSLVQRIEVLESFLLDKPQLLTREEAATYLKCHPKTIDYRRKKGQLKAYKNGRKVYFKKRELDEALKLEK